MDEMVRLTDHLDFGTGSTPLMRAADGRYPIYGANGVIGHTDKPNVRGPLIVIGRVGSFCGSLRYSEDDVWATENTLICRAKNPEETRYWYYVLQSCGLNRLRAGSGQPLLNQGILRSVSARVPARSERQRITAILGGIDDATAANERVIEAAEALMKALVAQVTHYIPVAGLAERSTVSVDPRRLRGRVAHYSFPAFDTGARPADVAAETIRSSKFLLAEPCVLFAKLNPRIARIWNVTRLCAQTNVASTEFVVLRPVGVDTSALWAALEQPEVLATLRQLVAGMTGSRQRIQPHELLGVLVRDVRRMSPGSRRAIASLGAVCDRRRAQSAELAQMRNTLLPALMSGKVRVRDGHRGAVAVRR